MYKRRLSVLLALCMVLVVSISASARADAPGWEVFTRVAPTDLPPGGQGKLIVYVYNVGAVSGSGASVTDILPPGVVSTGAEASPEYGATRIVCPGSKVVTCTLGSIRPGEIYGVNISVSIDPEPVVASGSEAANEVKVEGGGASEVAHQRKLVSFNTDALTPGSGFSGFDAWFTNPDGTTDNQAGSHPEDLTVAYALNVEGFEQFYEEPVHGESRTIDVNLPPGIIGDPLAVPRCSRKAFDNGLEEGESCPASSQVGIDTAEVEGIKVSGLAESFPVYNMVPPPGVAAQFAFNFNGIETFLDAGVRTGGDNGITEHVNNVPQKKITFNTTTIWGIPAEESHDWQRYSLQGCITGCAADVPPVPFLSLPTSCGAPLTFSIEQLGTWQGSNAVTSDTSVSHDEEGTPTGITGCEHLVHFSPVFSLGPETSYADTPTGVSTDLRVPQNVNPEELATSGLMDATVTLPEGMAINPGQATGLQACQASQEGRGPEGLGGETLGVETYEGPPSCPAASKVGTDEIETPLVPDKLAGNVYILQSNPPNLRLLVSASGDGVNLKIPGTVHLNETTGQLTATFENTPDAPFTHFKLVFSGGPQAALTTPTRCGTYQSTGVFTPWASPFVANALDTSSFQITSAPNGASCQWPLPFAPSMTAGSTTDQAGGYTNFTMLLQRGDGQQRIEKLQFKTPEGLLGMIANVPLCQEPQAGKGECSSASQIGHTVATAGPGPYPFEVPQAGGPPAPIYLTGPYDGAPFGLSIVVPVVAGPFNLGTVVVRAKIEVDSHTSQLTITTTEFPTILDGVPADIRAIDAVIDRPDFMFNPTDCNPMSFSGTARSTEGVLATLSSHFQMGSCQALKFAPNFKVSTSGKTSRASGASLTAKIVYPTGNLGFNQASSQSNIQSVKVDLPKQLPSRLTTLQKACPAQVFNANPANCPADSIVGHARALTPVLPVPIEGPAYFVSHAGEEFPNLILVLQGYGVTIDLVGDTFINTRTNITSSTFKQVPDVPIGSFELTLPQGQFSALAANTNLCAVKGGLKMPTAFTGQDGAEIHLRTPISITGCVKAKPKKAKDKKSGKGHKAKKK
jgi:hypothetical protein